MSNSNSNTTSITNTNVYQRFFEIDMLYKFWLSPKAKGKEKLRIALLVAARFGFVSAITLTWLFKIKRYKVLEFLRRQVEAGYFKKISTIRAADGVVFCLTHSGASYASELMGFDIYFRSSENINMNSIVHDSIMQFVMLAGINNYNSEVKHKPMWSGVVSENEFRRCYPSSSVKQVDGVVLNADGTVACVELENSYKRKSQTQQTLLKLKDAMLGSPKLYDKAFFIGSSDKVFQDTQRFQSQLLEELPNRYNKKTNSNYLTTEEALQLKDRLIFRTKFTEQINQLFYS